MLSEKRRAVIPRALDGLVNDGTLVCRGNAFCLPNQRTDLVRVPREGDERSEREVKHVPDVDLAEAVARLVAEARWSLRRRRTRRRLGCSDGGANGPAIQAALVRVVEGLSDQGRIERDSGELLCGRASGCGTE